MVARIWGVGLAAVTALAPALVSAQAPDSIGAHTISASTPTPVTSYEQFVVSTLGKPIALRHQNIVEGSEMISLADQGLRKDSDYKIDYVAGTIKITADVSMGQILRVSYEEMPEPQAVNPGIRALEMMGSEPERLPDKPNLSMGHFLGLASDAPVLLVAGAKASVIGSDASKLGTPPGQSSGFVLEDLSANVGHGIVSVGYEDLGAGVDVQAAKQAGIDEATVARLKGETGLKKFGVALQGFSLGSTTLNNSLRIVSDGHGSIALNDFNLANGPFSLHYSGQHVTSGFLMMNAMDGLDGDDRDAMVRASGVDFQSLDTRYNARGGSFDFSAQMTTDSNKQRVSKEDLQVNSKALKLDAGDQTVGTYFSQYSALPADQQQEMAAAAGTDKKWLSLETAPIGKAGQPLKVSALMLNGSMGSYASADVTAAGKGWSLQAGDRKNNNAFTFQPDFGDQQIAGDTAAILKMYDPNAPAPSDSDKSMYLFGNLDRYFARFTAQPAKGANLDVEGVTVKGATDEADIQTIIATSKTFDFNLHHTYVGKNFVEDSELMTYEQQKLGMDLGVNRTDVGGDLKLTGSAKLAFNMSNTDTEQGAALRDRVEYSDKRIDLSYSNDDVAAGFGTVPTFEGITGLTDPDAGTLAMLNGFKDQIWQGRWQPSARFNLQAFWENQHNDTTDQDGFDHVINSVWDPNKTTHMAFTYLDTRASNPFDILYDNRMVTFLLQKDFGKAGKLQYAHEEVGIDDPNGDGPPPVVGQQAPPPVDATVPLGNSSEDSLTYTANLDKKTQLQTQNSVMNYGNGTHEDLSANTISRELTPHFGVSYTETSTSKTGGSSNESNKYGFWIDVLKGIRFNYGFSRDLNELAGDDSITTIGVTPGDAGPIHLDSVNYGVNSWDNLHNQVSSNYGLHNTKPFKLGFLTDLKFTANMSTASDYTNVNAKNNLFSFGGKAWSNTFFLQYKSQLDVDGLSTATDRFASIQTDSNPRKWIEASMKIKERESIDTGRITIRDYSVTVRPVRNLEISNHLLTNPEVEFRPDVPMGSITSPWRVNQYKLDYKTSASTSIGATYEDRIDDANQAFYRTMGLDVELFRNTGSPLTLWYGMERGGGSGISNEYAQRFYFKYFEKPGPNQSFNIFVGNISYVYTNGNLLNRNSWGLRGEYVYSFW